MVLSFDLSTVETYTALNALSYIFTKTENVMEKIRNEGMEQLKKYIESEYIQVKFKENKLKAGFLIFKGKDEYEWTSYNKFSTRCCKL